MRGDFELYILRYVSFVVAQIDQQVFILNYLNISMLSLDGLRHALCVVSHEVRGVSQSSLYYQEDIDFIYKYKHCIE